MSDTPVNGYEDGGATQDVPTEAAPAEVGGTTDPFSDASEVQKPISDVMDPTVSIPTGPATVVGRNLVVCLDGSGDHYGPESTNSNVVKLFRLLELNSKEQLCYYQPGVGTGESNGINRLGVAIQKRIDFMIASRLEVHVSDAYKWLMDIYELGDRIFLFGFSRGSYTARALAGMLERVGLLGRGNDYNVAFAYRLYSKPVSSEVNQIAAGFKATFSRPVKVHFVGVWDTVSSVGLFIPKVLPFTSGNDHIAIFRHAVSIDERRARFLDNLWSSSLKVEAQVNMDADHRIIAATSEGVVTTDIVEVWFPGTHSDIGGGWPDDPPAPGTPASALPINLSLLPLRWMIREALAAGLLMESGPLSALRIGETAADEEAAAKATLHNTLPAGSIWWALEYLPTVNTTIKNGKPAYSLGIHAGKPRTIPEDAKIHRSVEIRNKATGYVPSGGFPSAYTYVD